jgi:hypothetical protein
MRSIETVLMIGVDNAQQVDPMVRREIPNVSRQPVTKCLARRRDNPEAFNIMKRPEFDDCRAIG